jgi:hypothetical protein
MAGSNQTSTTDAVAGQNNGSSNSSGSRISSSSSGGGSSNNQRLFVGVLSAAKNRANRDAVRATWGSDPRLVCVVFVLARPSNDSLLAAEAAVHHDIIMVGYIKEHYLNITHQTLEVMRAAYSYQQQLHTLQCSTPPHTRHQGR